MNDAEFAELAAWIAEAGLAGAEEKAMLAGFCERMLRLRASARPRLGLRRHAASDL